MLNSKKFSVSDLYARLFDMGWRGRYYGIANRFTYLNDENTTLAVVEYDSTKSLIVSVEYKR